MTLAKRLFDLIAALVLTALLLPVIVVTAIVILVLDGRPVFYVSERMRSMTQAFQLVKFRTMKHAAENAGVSGGDKSDRITRCGHFLRRTRLDEIPQLWNVLNGHISFVGPRPPLKQYVEKFPAVYTAVLRSRPGITGLASVKFHHHEEMLLARCTTSEETDATYSRACIPRKAKLDLIYQANRTICFDIRIMLMTVFKPMR